MNIYHHQNKLNKPEKENITAAIFSSERNLIQPSFKTTLKIDTHQIMDGLELLKQLPDNTIPLVFFDPQYGGALDKLKYGTVNKQKRRQALPQMNDALINRFVQEIDRILMPSGHLMFWVDKYILCHSIKTLMQGTHLQLVDLVTWDKGKMGLGYRTRRTCEYLIIFQKPPVRVKGIWQLHNIPDVWKEKISNRNHTHAKPIELQKRLIEAVTNEGDIIVDPTAGGYSVLKAALETKRHFIGCDINDKEKSEIEPTL